MDFSISSKALGVATPLALSSPVRRYVININLDYILDEFSVKIKKKEKKRFNLLHFVVEDVVNYKLLFYLLIVLMIIFEISIF